MTQKGWFVMFFGNEKEKRRRQLLGILKEFPWLWAVKSSWLPGYGGVEVHRADITSLLHQPREPRQIWVKVRLGELQKVEYVVQQANQTLAEAVCSAISSGYHIEYVIVAVSKDSDDRGKNFVILRDPLFSKLYPNLHRFCFRLAFPELTTGVVQ